MTKESEGKEESRTALISEYLVNKLNVYNGVKNINAYIAKFSRLNNKLAAPEIVIKNRPSFLLSINRRKIIEK